MFGNDLLTIENTKLHFNYNTFSSYTYSTYSISPSLKLQGVA